VLEQEIGNGQIQDRIAQKLEALVVIGRETPVGERLFKKGPVHKFMLETGLKHGKVGAHGR